MEQDKEIIATAEMPGLEKKEEKGYIYRERRSCRYYPSISLPSPVDPDNSKATYENGVLEIKMPKTEVKKKTPLIDKESMAVEFLGSFPCILTYCK